MLIINLDCYIITSNESVEVRRCYDFVRASRSQHSYRDIVVSLDNQRGI